MSLKRKLKHAIANHDQAAITKLRQRITVRKSRMAKAGIWLSAIARFALQFLGVKTPGPGNNIQFKPTIPMNNITGTGQFLNQIIIRLLSSNPKFFQVAQIISIITGLIAVILDYALTPATGLVLSDHMHAILTQVQVITGTLVIAFRLPVKDPVPEQKSTVAWLIESTTDQNEWLAANNQWTSVADFAMKFATEAAARAYGPAHLLDTPFTVTEHLFYE